MRLFLIVYTLFSSIQYPLTAQDLSIKGVILDENGMEFPGVQVDLHRGRSGVLQSVRSDEKGTFEFTNLEKSFYLITIQFLGYENDSIRVNLRDSSKILKPLRLRVATKTLSEIIVKDKKPIGAVLNDTLQFNASSFKVMKDASADELIEKMPTITKDQGTIKAQGDEVKQVLVDGKPFFGTDPNLSLKNLPAELIDKVQIFDQLSEQSQFTGINDGNTVKTINIVTKSGLNNGQFGKLYAGYGITDKYQVGGNYNLFDGDRRISIIGMSNDINVQNFSIDDILGVIGANSNQRSRNNFGGQGRPGNDPRQNNRNNSGGPGDYLVPQNGGISTTHAFGINYTDKLSSKLDLNISYFFNQSENKITSELNRQYFDSDTLHQTYFENTNSTTTNINHRINARLEFKIDSFNSIIFRPRLTFQSNHSTSTSDNSTSLNYIPSNTSDNQNQFKSDGYNLSNGLLIRHKFRKPGRTISLDFNQNSAPKTEDMMQTSFAQYSINGGNILDTISQHRNNHYYKWSWNSNVEYTEPIDHLNSISVNYRYSNGEDRTELKTFDLGMEPSGMDTLNTGLSNSFKSISSSQQIGIGYQFNKEQKWNINLRANWQDATLKDQQYFPGTINLEKHYYNILPSLFLRYTISKNRSFNVFFRTNTQVPSIAQLQNVLNNTNPLQLTTGNPLLKQSVNENMNIRYSSNNPNASILFLMIGGTYTSDYITNHIYIKSRNNPIFSIYNIANGVQLSIPENTRALLQLRSFASYTLPLSAIKCNLSFDASYLYSETPGLLDDTQFTTYQHNIATGLSLTSNISQLIDFLVQFRPTYNIYKSTDIKSNYFLLDQRVKFNWQFTGKNIVRIEFNSRVNQDLSQQYNQNIYLLNLAIGRKIFENERGEIAIGVNDLFNQNKSIQRTISDYYLEDSKNNTLQRFLMFSFTYNIRNYNTGKKPTNTFNPDQDRMRRWRD